MGRHVVKPFLPVPIVQWKSEGVDHSQDLFFLDWWPLLFSLEWWDLIRYGVYGFPTIYRWREPIVSRILGRNQ
jgi:hypothetical protein